ncbi:serine/threonine-protein phosphatase PP2A catalytic subunit-like [Cyclospora cayetanensis]|uniref:Serine/threonine-protein phosphatase n=1 Tax=Cyclospora cayetanensis TaxID=88456 RepID=A0A6P6RVR4_9EIME|nr:serine/threonine-protein phosphatase PP2A catalytic subunit-like [Cyclospora cayetanensis]
MNSAAADMSHKRLANPCEGVQVGALDAVKPPSVNLEYGSISLAYSSGAASTSCSSDSSMTTLRSHSESSFPLTGGESLFPAGLLADTPAVSPRPSAADIRREEERSERAVNASRNRSLQQQDATHGASRGFEGPASDSEKKNLRMATPDYGQEPLHLPTYLRPACAAAGGSVVSCAHMKRMLPGICILCTGTAGRSLNCMHSGSGALDRATLHSVDDWIAQLLRCQPLKAEEIKALCKLLSDLLVSEPNCVCVQSPVTVAGDIHGQFYDLLELFRVGGMPPQVNYLFMGDYVDRGFYSVEVFCLIAALKVRYPYSMAVLRGNHESRSITEVYGFYDECLRKYGAQARVWEAMTEAFDLLPLAASVDGSYFCTHGGLSRELQTLDQIQRIDRRQEPPPDGGMSELLWSDPFDFPPEGQPAEVSINGEGDTDGSGPHAATLDAEGWAPSSRGAGLLWGQGVTERFLHLNNMQCVCRAHQLVSDGHQWSHDSKVCTVFSAPNYCYRCGNKASLLVLDEQGARRFLSFRHAPERGDPEVVRTLPGYFV